LRLAFPPKTKHSKWLLTGCTHKAPMFRCRNSKCMRITDRIIRKSQLLTMYLQSTPHSVLNSNQDNSLTGRVLSMLLNRNNLASSRIEDGSRSHQPPATDPNGPPPPKTTLYNGHPPNADRKNQLQCGQANVSNLKGPRTMCRRSRECRSWSVNLLSCSKPTTRTNSSTRRP
jgi:hypothetical protein